MRPAFALLLLPLLTLPAVALDPADVYIVANKDTKDSLAVAQEYVTKRKVPAENVVALSLPTAEDISRADYDAKLAGPLREALKDKKANVKVLLTVYGVPLRVGPQAMTAERKAALEEAKQALADATKDRDKMTDDDKRAEARLKRKIDGLTNDQSTAAVDSELMLLWWPKYDLARWQMNPLYWQVGEADRKKAAPTLMTCRLDGPTPAIAMRLIQDALDAEKNGLSGKAYFDARGQKFDVTKRNQWTGYEGYDESFREAAAAMTKAGFDVTLDDKEAVFKSRSCPDAALYAGWYSHANYVDCCTFKTGAIAWHLASSEATTLRNKDSKVWCPNLLAAGAAVTLGPVAEPYTVGFPKPAEFFATLATGKYTVAEVYARTTPLTSWMTVLVGDPLYNPFKGDPKLKESDVVASPKGTGMAR